MGGPPWEARADGKGRERVPLCPSTPGHATKGHLFSSRRAQASSVPPSLRAHDLSAAGAGHQQLPAASEPRDGAVLHGELSQAPSTFPVTALLSQL